MRSETPNSGTAPFSPGPGAGSRLRPHITPRSVAAGPGSLETLGALCRGLGRHALFVTYPPGRTTATGWPQRSSELLESVGVEITPAAANRDPDVALVDSIATVARRNRCDFVVAIGGGAVLDAAKVAALLAVNDGVTADYQMARAPEKDAIPIVAIPTTVGTGSDATRVGVIRNRELGVVKSIGHPSMVPTVSILDPRLLETLPMQQAMFGAFDALSHALEGYLSRGGDPFSRSAALQALDLLVPAIRQAADSGADRTSDAELAEMLMTGSYLAGIGLHAGPALAHILAQPVTAVTGAAHAQVISAILPTTLASNGRWAEEPAGVLSRRMGYEVALPAAVADLRRAAKAEVTLAELGVTPANVDAIVSVALRSQSHIWTNPRPVDADLLHRTLVACLSEQQVESAP